LCAVLVATFDHLLPEFPDHCALPVSFSAFAPVRYGIVADSCLSVYVGMPKIAQHGVDQSSIEVTTLKFLEPTSNSIVLTQDTILHSPSIFTPTLDPFNADSFLVTNGTFGPTSMLKIPMPRVHALHPSSNQSVSGVNLTIQNLEQVTAYASAIITQENVSTALVGRTKLHVGALPVVTINFNSTSTYKGI